MTIHSPEEIADFAGLSPIDRAVLLKDYLTRIEEEEKRVKGIIEDLLKTSVQDEVTATDDWRIVVRYSTGISVKPDVTMLETEFPEKYALLRDEQLKAWRPSMTKSDVDWLFAEMSKEEREAAAAGIMVEHPVRPQYLLQAIKRGDA